MNAKQSAYVRLSEATNGHNIIVPITTATLAALLDNKVSPEDKDVFITTVCQYIKDKSKR